MNRTFLLALTLVFSFACSQPTRNDNGNANSNSYANANRGDEGITTGSSDKLVVITLGTKGTEDKLYFSVAPEMVKVSVSKGQQIEWIISNPFPDVTLSNIRITNFAGGTIPNKDPFSNGGTFTFPEVSSQSTANQLSGRSEDNKKGTYTYDVIGTATRGSTSITVSLDPRVVVGD